MQDVLLKDVLPYIQMWTGVIIAILIMVIYYFWRFERRHPEIFQPDTTADDKQWLHRKAELRRRYHNKAMMAFVVVFIWMVGLTLIFLGFAPTNQGWFMLIFAVFLILWVLSLMQRESKK